LRFQVAEDSYKNFVQNRHRSWRQAHSQRNHTISQPVLAIYPKEVRSIFLRLSRLLTSEKDPVADWLVAATVLKSADYLPDLTTEVWPLLWRLTTVTINDLARFFQAPIGFTLNTRRRSMRLCGNGLTKPTNTVITTIMDHTTSYKLNQNRLSWTVEIFRNGIYFIVWVEENHVNVFYVHIGRNSIYKADEYGPDEVEYPHRPQHGQFHFRPTDVQE
jgi:hypothetical protein